jgi:alginate O-acetyltransferase complex protein AlgI
MLFNSAVFLLFFLPVTIIGYQALASLGRRWVIAWLAFASIVFYSWWNWRFLFVLLGSMLLNFAVSWLITASTSAVRKRFLLVTGITINLAGLFYFKYLFHVLRFLQHFGVGDKFTWQDVALPLGISFFTFTQIAYLIDLSQGQAQPQNIVEYGLFVSFFPHLIAGPIIHHKEMMPQFLSKTDPHLKMDDMLLGISWFVLGLAKKCILADYFGPYADASFASSRTLGMPAAWLGIVLYSLQLYFDFSGYSDMALGLARMFSIRFPLNFNSPYKSASIIEFWQRWHMTLSRYFTLYLYNPVSLAVNRRRLRAGKKISQKGAKTVPGFSAMIAFPTMVTMVLVGLWHGAGLQFLIFGVLHGFYLTVNQAWRLFRGEAAERQEKSWLSRAGSILLTYGLLLISLVIFRANGIPEAFRYLAVMTGIHGMGKPHSLGIAPLALGAAGLFIAWFLPNTQEILGQYETATRDRFWFWLRWKPSVAWSLSLGVLLFLTLLFQKGASAFLYFQF